MLANAVANQVQGQIKSARIIRKLSAKYNNRRTVSRMSNPQFCQPDKM
jgi:hypothetical protein